MPKSAKIPDDPTEGATVHAAINGINEESLKGFVRAVEEQQGAIDAIMAKAKQDCQPYRDEIKAIKKAAAEADIPKKPFSAKIRERTLRRKADTVDAALSDEHKTIFAEISLKLDDMPQFAGLDS